MELTNEDLVTILTELFEAKIKWFDVGLQLKLDVSILEGIKANSDPNDCFHEMFIAWLKSSSKVEKTWKTLVMVLKSKTVGYESLAERIDEKFCQSQAQTMKAGKRQNLATNVATKRPCLEEDRKNVDDRVEDLKKQLSEKEWVIQQLQEEHQQFLVDNEAMIKALRGEIESQKEKRERLSQLQEQNQHRLVDSDKQIKTLREENKSLTEEKERLNQKCREFEKQLKQMTEQIGQVKSQSRLLETLQSDISKKEKEIQELKTQTQSREERKPEKVTKRHDVHVNSCDIGVIRRELLPVKDDWHALGLELEVLLSSLDNIKKKYKNDSKECLLRTIEIWIGRQNWWNSEKYTWGVIIDALRSPVLEQNELADSIEAKYCVEKN